MFHQTSSAAATAAMSIAARPRARGERASASAQDHHEGDRRRLPTARMASHACCDLAENATAHAISASAAAATATSAPGRRSRQPLAHVVGEQLANEDSQDGDEHERAAHRPPEQVDARHILERPSVERRVAAQHVEQRENEHARQQAGAAAEQATGGKAEPQQHDADRGADEQIVQGPVGGAHLGKSVEVGPPIDSRSSPASP